MRIHTHPIKRKDLCKEQYLLKILMVDPVDTSKPEVANVVGAMTKDYSQLMKAIDKKKGR